MKQLTSEELEAIRKRAEAATEGPWRIGRKSPNGLNNIGTMGGLLTAQTLIEEDATFIAHAREDTPKLLAEIERLQTENDLYEMAVEEDQRVKERYVSEIGRYRDAINTALNRIEEVDFKRGEPLYTAYYVLLESFANDEGEPPSDMSRSGVSISDFKTVRIGGGNCE